MLQVEQRAAEGLIAFEQQVGDAARTGQASADGLRGRLAVEVVLGADPRAQLVQQLVGRRRALGQQVVVEAPGELRPVALQLRAVP